MDHIAILGWLLAIILAIIALGVLAWVWRSGALRPGSRATLAGEDDHGPTALLFDINEPTQVRRIEITGRPAVIGRVAGNDDSMDYIVVEERTVGRWHATIERRGQSFWIRDEGSVNGTFVNDERVITEHPLKHGDIVRVHEHAFEFAIPEFFDSERTIVAGEEGRMAAAEMADAARSLPRD